MHHAPSHDDLLALVENQRRQLQNQANRLDDQAARVAALEAELHRGLHTVKRRGFWRTTTARLRAVATLVTIGIWALSPGLAAANGAVNVWVTGASMPTGREDAAVATGADGLIYAIGGYDGSNIVETVEAYDPVSNTWSTKVSPTTIGAGASAVAAPCHENSAQDCIYAIGGSDSTSSGNTEEYDPTTNTWTQEAQLGTRLTHTSATTAACWNALTHLCIYVIGGAVGLTIMNNVEMYDPTTTAWVAAASLPAARAEVGATTGPDGKIYAIGGYDSTNNLQTVDAYNPATNTWTPGTDMPTARSGLGVATGPDGQIYAIGGNGGTPLNTVEEYDPATDTWTSQASMPTGRVSLSAVTGPDGRIYAIGGTNGSFLGTVEIYSVAPATYGSGYIGGMGLETDAIQPAGGVHAGLYGSTNGTATGDPGVRGVSDTGPGGSFGSTSGPDLHLDASTSCPPASVGSPGDLCADANGVIYACAMKVSPPCTWHPLGFSDGGPTVVHVSAFHVIHAAKSTSFHWTVGNPKGIVGFDVYSGGNRLDSAMIRPHVRRTYSYVVSRHTSEPGSLHVILTDGQEATLPGT